LRFLFKKEVCLQVKCLIKRSEYHDSVSLMLAAQELARLPGVLDAAVVMATEANKGILKEAGLLTPEAESASPNDLVIAVNGDEEALDQALAEAGKLLQKKVAREAGGDFRPKTIRGALKSNPAANVAVISVAGRFAADEAWEALRNGLHVLLFSDNVSLEDEIALKKYAVEHGLLLMGPGAGTAILNGVALGFANVVPPGPVGIVSAAGTGLQEVSTLLARRGAGITQGIGTGGRDLSEEVGGRMMLAGLAALQEDPATGVIVLVSKPPAPAVARSVLDQADRSEKPAVACFLGGEFAACPKGVRTARTLEDAANLAAGLAAGDLSASLPAISQPEAAGVDELRQRLKPGQRWLRGLYSGGTLCFEAQVVWRDHLAEPVFSNAPLDRGRRLPDPARSLQHTAIDLGEEEFTVGRLHPMIDHNLRIRRMLQEARDPETAVLLLDVVLGYGAHPDPAAELGPAVHKAQSLAAEGGRELVVVASITGTEQDPQCLSRQARALGNAGVVLCESNAAAARLAAKIVSE
jgi:FdrA protein